MSNIISDLKQKRKIIEQFQRDMARQEGEEAQLFKQLKDECDVDSVEKAEVKIEKLSGERDEIKELLGKLDEEMGEIIVNAQSESNPESI